jgi:cyclopropane-fatty-acyl-phospholipid synthase
MLEAVGEAFWPRYFDTLRARLIPGGIAVLQVITIDDARFEGYRRAPDFIQRHIFPGGMLPPPGALRRCIADTGLVLQHVETFGDSYALTLAVWRRRFLDAWPQIAAMGFSERFRRMWDYYLCYCEAGFRAGAIDVGLWRIARPA